MIVYCRLVVDVITKRTIWIHVRVTGSILRVTEGITKKKFTDSPDWLIYVEHVSLIMPGIWVDSNVAVTTNSKWSVFYE